MSNQFIFNQYYIDLIKRIKTSAKNMRDNDKDDDRVFGKSILKAIKDNYITLDKSSDEYIIYVKTVSEDFWVSYINIDDISLFDLKGNKIICEIIDLGSQFDYDLPKDGFRIPFYARKLKVIFNTKCDSFSSKTFVITSLVILTNTRGIYKLILVTELFFSICPNFGN